MNINLTDRLVKTLPTPASGNKTYFDATIKGFGVRVTAAGARAFVLNYRTRSGRERRYTIGRFPEWSTGAARTEAKKLRLDIAANGADPVGNIQAEKVQPTMQDLVDRYVREHLPRKRARSAKEDMYLMKHIQPLLKAKVASISFTDIDRLHQKITRAGTPIAANRVHSLLSKMFSLSIRWQWRDDNPCRNVEKNLEHKRERFLTADEIARLDGALAACEHQSSAHAIRLLLLTGARRGEVLSARWSEFDLTSGTWTKPASNTKQKKVHVIPLSGPARLLLASMRPKAKGEYLFPGRVDGHQADLGGTWDAICEAAGLHGVRLHDLRHSFASVLASSGTSLHVIGSLLGHSNPATTARYSHLTDQALRSATEIAGAAIAGGESAEVLPMQKRR